MSRNTDYKIMFTTTEPDMLNTLPSSPSRKPASARRGSTLIEMLLAVATGTCIMGSIMTTGITATNTIVAIGNYCDLNRASRHTLDMMSAELCHRQVAGQWQRGDRLVLDRCNFRRPGKHLRPSRHRSRRHGDRR